MPLSQEDFGRLFRRMLSQYDVGTIPVALDRVTAGDFDRMRRRSIRHLLVLGASDERLPRVSDGAGVFTDTERSERARSTSSSPAATTSSTANSISFITYSRFPNRRSTSAAARLPPARARRAPPSSPTVSQSCSRFARRTATCMPRERSRSPALELACAGDAAAREFFRRARRERGASPPSKRPPRRNAGGSPARACARSTGRSSISRPRASITLPPAGSSSSCVTVCAPSRARARSLPRRSAERFCTSYWKTWRAVWSAAAFAETDDKTVAALTDKYVREYVRTQLEDFREKSPRFVYLFRRLAETSRRIARHGAGAAPLRLPPARL